MLARVEEQNSRFRQQIIYSTIGMNAITRPEAQEILDLLLDCTAKPAVMVTGRAGGGKEAMFLFK